MGVKGSVLLLKDPTNYEVLSNDNAREMFPGRKWEICCVAWKQRPSKVSDLGRITESLGRILSLGGGFLFGPLPTFPSSPAPSNRTCTKIISVYHFVRGYD